MPTLFDAIQWGRSVVFTAVTPVVEDAADDQWLEYAPST